MRPAAPGLVLLVDDEPLLLRALRRILVASGHRIALAGCEREAEAHLADPDLAVAVCDLVIGAENGLALLDRIKRERPDVEVVMMTGHSSVQSAVRCIRRGAFDYLEKPFRDPARVRATVDRAVARRCVAERSRVLARLGHATPAPGLVGGSPAMQRLQRTIAGLRENESHVLIQGESGTGKELVALALRANSPRTAGPFVPVDCGALPQTLIESELFGHERGSFTGATDATPGLFRLADGGTLFLDEVGELPLPMQAKLLRALQHKEVRPVGAARPVPVDLRVISATHRDLAAMVADGGFRGDLYYRLDVVRIEIPPLRERRDDIPLLVQHFLAKHRRARAPLEEAEADALEELVSRDWPGNVRELENALESAIALAPGPRLRAADLPPPGAPRARRLRPDPELPLTLEAFEHAALERALSEAGGDARVAARRLGIGRSTFYRKLARHRQGESRGGSNPVIE